MKHLYKVILISCLFVSFNGLSQQLAPLIEWQKSLGGSKIDRANSVIRTVDNGYLVVGLSFSNDGQVTGHHGSTDSSDAWVVKLDRDGNVQWQKSLGGTRNDYFKHAIQAANGDFLCVGATESNNGDVSGLHGNLSDLWICRLTSTGTLLWSKVYGGTDPDHGQVIRKASDGGGYVVGGSAESGDGDITNHIGWSDIWVLKINENGAIQWQKKYGNYNHQFINDLTVLRDGSYAIAGYQTYKGFPTCFSSPVYAFYMEAELRIDKNGNVIWEYYPNFQCGNPGTGNFNSELLELPSGELFDVGHTFNASQENFARWRFRKLNPSNGQARVTVAYSFSSLNTLITTSQGTAPNAAVMLPDSTVLSTHTGSYNSFSPRVEGTLTLISTGDAPNILYQKKYGGSNNEFFNSIEVINQSEYIVAGYSNSNNIDVSGNHGDYDAWIVKFSSLNKITGRVYVDNNANGIKDAGENYFTNVKVSSTKGGKAIASSTNANGLFLNNVDTGTYSTTVNLIKPYFTVNPATKSSAFATYNGKDSFDFALVPIPNKKDLKITVTGLSRLRPGFTASYRIDYVNDGTEVMNGVVVKLALPSNMDFISSTPAQTTYATDTVTWNVGTLASRATGSINLVLKGDPPPALSMGDVVSIIGIIEPAGGDETPNDNRDTLRQGTTGSFDPNDKAENLNGIMAPSQLGGGITYTIRFQNTGNDTAFNVVIKDTLDAKLDWSSVEMLSVSHPVHTSITQGNILTWTFTDILLPDSNVNEPASHGYIIYHVKPKLTLAVGDVISNSASIYFDFNLPVKTNTTQTEIKPPTVPQPSVSGVAGDYCSIQGVQSGKINNLPPTGSGTTVSVKLDGNAIAVAADSTFSFDVSALAAGAHAIVVTYSNGSETTTSTLNFNVNIAVSPDVNVGANTTNVTNLLDPIVVTANNASGGGSAPLYTFAKDRNITNLWQAESSSNVLNITGNALQSGDNWIYVRMKTSATCFTTSFNIDSVKIVLALPVPNQPVITGLKTSYCANEGTQKAKLTNYPAAGTGSTVTVKLDGNAIALNMADTSFSFNLAPGNHLIEATYANAAGSRTTTANFTVTNTITPGFEITGYSTQIVSTDPIVLSAVNIKGGGAAPAFTFALDRNFTNLLRAEATDPSFTFNPAVLKIGANKVYVRMKTSAACYTQQTIIDSFTITKYGASGIVDPDFQTQRITANPNPFRSRLVVHGINVAKTYTLTIHNHQGTKVFQRRVAGALSATLHLPALPAGIYTLSIYDETKGRLIGTINIAKQ